MRRAGISREVLVAAALPAALVTLVIGIALVAMRIADLREHQHTLGQAVAAQLAPAAEYGVFAGNQAVLQRLATAALAEADLRSVVIRDRRGEVLASAVSTREPEDSGGPVTRWVAARFLDPDATARFEAPIVQQPLPDLGEFDLPGFALEEPRLGSVEIEIALLPALAHQLQAALTGLAILFAGLFASLLLARRLGERVVAPIERLALAMQRVRDGDLTVRVPERSDNEIGLLESGLNRMAGEIERTQRTLEERIARATRDLNETIAALEVSNVELDLARRRALEASHLKSEFLASMSHEIRTPMSGIIGFADLLARSETDPERREQVLTIRQSAEALMGMLNDVLDLSRIEAGKLTLASEDFSIRACLDDALAVLAPLAYGKGLDLQRGVSRDVPDALRGDRTRIGQIITNLVSNAIKHTAVGHVRIEVGLDAVRDDGVMVRITVTDTGVGIPVEVQRLLFRAFGHAAPAGSHQPGAGLGLVICNRLVEAMHGEIELESAPGEGSRFSVTLELARGDAPAPLPRIRTAVVADDDPLTRDHVAQLLEAAGHRVTAVPRAALADTAPADILVLGLADPSAAFDDAASATRHGSTVLLLNTLDAERIEPVREAVPGICLPRCSTHGALMRAVGAAAGGASAEPDPRPLAGLRVLVVDDNRVNRTLFRRQLTLLGAEVDDAADGTTAVSRCTSQAFDAVLLDLQMPDIGGAETARRIAAGPTRPLLVAVTANVQAALTRYPPADGLDAVLVKPVREPDVVQAVSTHVRRRGAAAAALAALSPDIRALLAEDLPAQARAWHSAVGAADAAQVRTAAHDLSGTAAACRLHALRGALARLDADAPLADCSRLFEVAGELTALESALKERD